MKEFKVLISALFVLILMACGDKRTDERIVSVTIEPQRYFAEKIAGDKFKIKKYMYSDMANKDVIGLEKIKLPVYSSGEPNWKYMEQYMKNIESQVRTSIDKLTNVIGGGVSVNG